MSNSVTTPATAQKGQSLWQQAWRRLVKNKAAMVSIVILLLMAGAALITPHLRPFALDEVFWDLDFPSPPSLENGHWFGTDGNGRDLFVRTMFGIAYGAIAGYHGGRTDSIMMRVVDVLYAMPFMFFVILLMTFFGKNIYLMFAAIGAIEWLTMARIVRGQAMSLRHKEFVAAAEVLGVSTGSIVKRHIVPNTLGTVIVYVTLTIPAVILTESFLSFLGLGVQEPMTSLGVLISEGADRMETAPWMLIFPAIILATILFCFNFVGDGLRDALDPKDR